MEAIMLNGAQFYHACPRKAPKGRNTYGGKNEGPNCSFLLLFLIFLLDIWVALAMLIQISHYIDIS